MLKAAVFSADDGQDSTNVCIADRPPQDHALGGWMGFDLPVLRCHLGQADRNDETLGQAEAQLSAVDLFSVGAS